VLRCSRPDEGPLDPRSAAKRSERSRRPRQRWQMARETRGREGKDRVAPSLHHLRRSWKVDWRISWTKFAWRAWPEIALKVNGGKRVAWMCHAWNRRKPALLNQGAGSVETVLSQSQSCRQWQATYNARAMRASGLQGKWRFREEGTPDGTRPRLFSKTGVGFGARGGADLSSPATTSSPSMRAANGLESSLLSRPARSDLAQAA
jgi:hypothetical protein